MRNFFVSAFLLLVGIAVMTVCRMNNNVSSMKYKCLKIW